MKKLLIAVLLLALFLQPTAAQQEYKIFLPLVSSNWSSTMSNWKIVVPEITQNYCLNPSAEIAGNFAAVGGGTHTRVTTVQFVDVYSYRVQTAANDQGGSFTLLALSNNIHYVTMRVAGTLPASWDWSLDNAAYTTPVLLEAIDATWSLYGLEFPAAQANTSTLLYVRQNGAGAGDFNIDGIQVEQKTYWTTYCDGTRPGCEWNGAAHASTSQRSAVSRAGGLVQDLQDDYNFEIGGMIATGMPAVINAVDSYAILPGGELNSIKVESRVFTLTGVIRGTNLANLHANRQALLNVLKPNAVPKDAAGPQPVRLRHIGAAVQKQIAAHYEAGLETTIEARMECWERLAIRFLADDPYWYEIGDSAAVLDSNDAATFRIVAGRLRDTGQWDDLGPPNAAGTYNDIRAIAVDIDKTIYWVGTFTNFDNDASADNIVRYIPSTGTWAPLAAGLSARTFHLIIGPDGTIYVSGEFQNAGGDANADGLAQWNGAAFSSIGAIGLNVLGGELGYGFAIDQDGILYFGGDFLDFGGIAAADYIAQWSGAAWSAVGTGFDNPVRAIAISPSNELYAAGQFTATGGATPVTRIAKWNGADWEQLGSGLSSTVFALAFDIAGNLYAGGAFTNAGGDANADYIARWNGTAWDSLGGGVLNGTVYSIKIAPDGILYATGAFTSAGGIIVDRIALHNGSSWAALDIETPGGGAIMWDVALGEADPVVERNYDIWMGFDSTGAGALSGTATVTNGGTERAYPKFIISRNGGTSATLIQLRNETTGSALLFDYALLDNEVLTIDLTPTTKSIVSSFFGSRLDAILANSDFGIFALQPGNNQITAFVATVGGPTVNAFIQWDDKFLSQD